MGPNICVLYMGDAKTGDHILFNCTFSNHIWNWCARRFEININIALNGNLWNRLKKSDHETQIVRTLTATFCWNIWRENNSRIFNSTHYSVCFCMYHIVHDTILWTCILSDEDILQGQVDKSTLGYTLRRDF